MCHALDRNPSTHIIYFFHKTFCLYRVCITRKLVYFYVVVCPTQVINYYYIYIENHMDADSVSHMMYCKHLITDDDYEAITAAPNDSKMNTVLLQYIKAMNMNQMVKFCDILKNIETQKKFAGYLSACECM